jgi:hypothetical protein
MSLLLFCMRLSGNHIGEIIIIGDSLRIAFNIPQYFKTGLNYTPADFNEQAKHIRGPRINFTDSPRPSNSRSAILRNYGTMGARRRTNRSEEFSRCTNILIIKGPQRNFVDISPINVISPICFHLSRIGNINDNVSSQERFENSKLVEALIYT